MLLWKQGKVTKSEPSSLLAYITLYIKNYIVYKFIISLFIVV